MPKRDHTSLYYADDRDVYDLLKASNRGLPTAKLQSYARQRGIVFPSKAPREYIIAQLSLIDHSWRQIHSLLEKTDSDDRAEKKTSRNPQTSDGLAEANAHFEAIRDARSEQDEIYTITRHSDKSLIVKVQYTELDTKMTRLFQRRQREIVFQIMPTASGLKIRHEANQKANSIAAELLSKLTPRDGAKSSSSAVDLSSIRDPAIRTGFFLHLMTKMNGFRFEDVEYIDVDRIVSDEGLSADSEQEASAITTDEKCPKDPEVAPTDMENDKGDPDDSTANADEIKQMTDEALEMKGAISQATFRGERLLQSQVYIDLKNKGYFISHSIWLAVEDKADGKRVEFQAQFENGPEASGFKYSVRKVHERFSNGKFKKAHIDLSSTDLDIFESVIESTAELAFAACVESETKKSDPKVEAPAAVATAPGGYASAAEENAPTITEDATKRAVPTSGEK